MGRRGIGIALGLIIWSGVALPGGAQAPGAKGVLLLAHGGSESWNANVQTIAEEVNRTLPTEVALGMATRGAIQDAIDRLAARGVKQIVAVPLFVSSHSSVVTSTEYLLGLRPDMPADLAIFAKMSHGKPGAAHADHQGDGTTPVRKPVPVTMSPALDAHPLVAAIVASRAQSISRTPKSEAVILVAHGPQTDETNRLWLASLDKIGTTVAAAGYASVDSITVRDDAPAPIRDRATVELRALVGRRQQAGSRVLIVPVLLSFGGIEQGVKQRLEGLEYAMTQTALAPDRRLVQWVLEMAR